MPRRAPLDADHVAFAAALDARLRGRGHVWSPYSVGEALALLAEGARGPARQELEQALGGDTAAQARVLAAAVDAGGADGPELAAATSLWLASGAAVDPGFERALAERTAASVRTADFARAPEAARAAANAEVADLTRGLIPELLQAGDITADTRALLVNALWVRLAWTAPFDPAATRPARFRAPADELRVPMMRRSGDMPYAEADGWAMVGLDGGHGLTLDLLLPPSGGSAGPAPLPEVDAGVLERLAAQSRTARVDLAVPRFRLSGRALLSGALKDLGVRTVFTPGADLSGIARLGGAESGRPFFVDEIVHEAVLTVDEKGAEGAAATAVVLRTLSAVTPPKAKAFTADRPFAFVLRRNGAILFLGTVESPDDPGPAR
ncbi:serpin family protein [Nocardiopsis coralliicola]